MNTTAPTSLLDLAMKNNGEPITEDSAALTFKERHRNELRYDHDIGSGTLGPATIGASNAPS